MIPKTKMDAFTPVDRLQLGRSEVNPEDMQNADKEIEELKEQVQKVSFLVRSVRLKVRLSHLVCSVRLKVIPSFLVCSIRPK